MAEGGIMEECRTLVKTARWRLDKDKEDEKVESGGSGDTKTCKASGHKVWKK